MERTEGHWDVLLFSQKVLVSHPLLEGTSCFFELQTPFANKNGLGRRVVHYGSCISTTYKLILLITLLLWLSTGNRSQRERLLCSRKKGTFWSIDHEPRGCSWVKICKAMWEESKFSENAHTCSTHMQMSNFIFNFQSDNYPKMSPFLQKSFRNFHFDVGRVSIRNSAGLHSHTFSLLLYQS